MKKFWTKQEDEFLKENYSEEKMSIKEIADTLNRTKYGIINRARKFGLKHKKGWTKAEEKILKEEYPTVSARDIAKKLGKNYYAVLNRAYLLGLKKDKAFFQAEGKRLLKSGKAHQFKKGHIPANKGKKMTVEMRERVKHTWYKKGNEPVQTKYDGAITIRHEKGEKPYQYIRLSKAKWEALHRHVWKQHNGQIPKGYNIVFKNNDTLDCRIENLECISNEENMQRNTIHNYPDELKSVIRKTAKIKRKIEESKKEKQ